MRKKPYKIANNCCGCGRRVTLFTEYMIVVNETWLLLIDRTDSYLYRGRALRSAAQSGPVSG